MRLSRLLPVLFVVLCWPTAWLHAQPTDTETLLLRDPTVSDASIAFAYANDLWIVSREGGNARRLTSFPGTETQPHFSPDGQHIAFTGQYDGDTDVFVVSADGGEPRRVTHHPSSDLVRGWTPDGRVLFTSYRNGGPRLLPQIFAVDPDEGGLPERISVPRAYKADLAADGQRLAYELVDPWDPEWRNYRGGQAQPIRILDLESMQMQKLPWDGSRDRDPVWLGDTVYFLSERDRAMNVWSYDTASGELAQVSTHAEYDVKTVEAGGGVVVYEQGGRLHLHDPDAGTTETLEITVRGDFPWTRPAYEEVSGDIRHAGLSPTGVRAVFEARGEIFTVPAENGAPRNLSESSGAADRNPAWSPDGEHVAWFSDASGEYRLMIRDQKGLDEPRSVELPGPTFYYTPAWSPDSEHILFTDTDLNLWVVDVESGDATKVDTDGYAHPERTVDPVWSPNSEWVAYAKRLDNLHHVVMLYSMESGEATQVTPDMMDARNPAFDASGDHLYFLGSTNLGLNTGWLDMSSYGRPATHGLYAALLSEDGTSPLLPESDEEPLDGDDRDEEEEDEDTDEPMDVDLDGIEGRIVDLGVEPHQHGALQAGPEGIVFFTRQNTMTGATDLVRYTLEDKEASPFLEGAGTFTISHDRSKLLYNAGNTWGIVPTEGEASTGDGALQIDLQARIDPVAEWNQIFREAWRFQRDYLYVENLHGADWDAVYERYQPWMQHVRHRSDLNYVLDILGGEVSIGHSYTGGGDTPDIERVGVGLLGADYSVENGRYVFETIYRGEIWDAPGPLAHPGMDVSEGDYLLAVNGVELTAEGNPHALLAETAGKATTLTVSDTPSMDDARNVVVEPVGSESGLRLSAWVKEKRERVAELSDGRIGYVYVPNTSGDGYASFTHEYFAQQRHEGIVIDERYNGGGSAADYMVDIMSRDLHGYFNNPVGDRTPFTSPGAGLFGPKVMIINEMAGSGGDYLPYLFRKMEIGPLVGTRTWGGLVGIWDTPPLLDGGGITAPRGGFFTPDGEWAIEGEGIAPDIEVEMTPSRVENGFDPQLDRAVEEAVRLLENGGDVELIDEPAPPVRVQRPE